jgi:hypothetical protein
MKRLVFPGLSFFSLSGALSAQAANCEPQYGGWCVYAADATVENVSAQPETFKIVDIKLYLFYNKFFNMTPKSWSKDERNLNAKADASWKIFFNRWS